MGRQSEDFKMRLATSTGYSDSAIEAAWPEWWSEAAEESPSAQAELRFSVARKLGLDPRSLADSDGPRFMWDDSAKYKSFTGSERERLAITSFGRSVGRMLIQATPSMARLDGVGPEELRKAVLANFPFVTLQTLLGFLWGVGIPTIHVRVHPLSAKRMCAMAVSENARYALLLARDAQYPAWAAFYVAHEIGHICLGHISDCSAVIDMEALAERTAEVDEEELQADRFALHLLTGDPDFKVEKVGRGRSPDQLASGAMRVGHLRQIEPGTLALCYGYATGEWATVQAAIQRIYERPSPVWEFINRTAEQQLEWDAIGDDAESFLRATLGGI